MTENLFSVSEGKRVFRIDWKMDAILRDAIPGNSWRGLYRFLWWLEVNGAEWEVRLAEFDKTVATVDPEHHRLKAHVCIRPAQSELHNTAGALGVDLDQGIAFRYAYNTAALRKRMLEGLPRRYTDHLYQVGECIAIHARSAYFRMSVLDLLTFNESRSSDLATVGYQIKTAPKAQPRELFPLGSQVESTSEAKGDTRA